MGGDGAAVDEGAGAAVDEGALEGGACAQVGIATDTARIAPIKPIDAAFIIMILPQDSDEITHFDNMIHQNQQTGESPLRAIDDFPAVRFGNGVRPDMKPRRHTRVCL